MKKIEQPQDIELESYYYFPSIVYIAKIPEFLSIVKNVSDEYLKLNTNEINEIYPVHMSNNFSTDQRLYDFCSVISQTGWDILNSQGYNMPLFETYITAMWTQEHHKHSLMEHHVHGEGNQLVGFYFLETPKDCSRPIFHDPRPSKEIINLPETDMRLATPASGMINFDPQPGTIIITNAWLPHSFSRHASEKPIRFVHFNINVKMASGNCDLPEVEII